MDKAPQGHTPGKWRASECRSTCNVNILETGKRDGVVIGILNRSTAVENRANAQFVVTACNSHYDLLEVLKNAIISIQITKLPRGSGVASNEQILEIMKQSFEQAIAKAEGKG